MQEMSYTQTGDYLIPDIRLKEESGELLGKYGRMRRTYLKEHREILYNRMLMNGTLYQHLLQIEQTAQERLQTLMQQGMRKENLNEQMKAQNPLRWTGLMNSLKAQAEEIILKEIIFS